MSDIVEKLTALRLAAERAQAEWEAGVGRADACDRAECDYHEALVEHGPALMAELIELRDKYRRLDGLVRLRGLRPEPEGRAYAD